MKKYYHYTKKSNILNIISSKRLRNNGCGVFACDTKEDLLKFINFYLNSGSIKLEEVIFIEFETNIEFEESYDHDSETFGNARAVVCFSDHVPLLKVRLHEIVY